jgi:Respiratory nitrate reductase alpha N-terminal
MSHFLERLTYLTRRRETFADGLCELRDEDRMWRKAIGSAGSTSQTCYLRVVSLPHPNGSRAFHFAVAQQGRRSATRRTGHFAL